MVQEPLDPADRIVVGRLGAAHGIRGGVRVHSFTDPPSNLLRYSELWLRSNEHAEDWRGIRLVGGRQQGRALIVQFEGVESRDQAEMLTGGELAVDISRLPKLETGEYYWYQLQGLIVVSTEGHHLGRVDHLLETGSNDVLVVRADAESMDQRERLLPYLPGQVVQDVDLQSGVMTVDWDPDF